MVWRFEEIGSGSRRVGEKKKIEDELKFLYEMAFWLHTCFDGLEVMIAEWGVATLNFESPH